MTLEWRQRARLRHKEFASSILCFQKYLLKNMQSGVTSQSDGGLSLWASEFHISLVISRLTFSRVVGKPIRSKNNVDIMCSWCQEVSCYTHEPSLFVFTDCVFIQRTYTPYTTYVQKSFSTRWSRILSCACLLGHKKGAGGNKKVSETSVYVVRCVGKESARLWRSWFVKNHVNDVKHVSKTAKPSLIVNLRCNLH